MNDSVVRTCLRDPEKERLRSRGITSTIEDRLVHLSKFQTIHMLSLKELRVTGVDDLHLLEHLANDDPNVFVVDLHSLEPVDLLNLIQKIFLDRTGSFDFQDVVGVDRSF